MWTLSREMRFEASHCLEMCGGNRGRPHGHSWRVRVTVESHQLCHDGPEKGMLMDYSKIGDVMDGIREQLDHRHLNDALDIYPTSENLAAWIYRRLEERFYGLVAAKLRSVTVWETEENSCTYRPDRGLGLGL